jgi:preprotein translocase subunit SecD
MSWRVAVRSAVLLVLCGLISAFTRAADQPDNHPAGFYLIAAQAASAEALPRPTAEQQIARYDAKFLVPSERTPAKYLLLPKRPDVELKLAKAPDLEKGENGFPELRLELTTQAAANLEKLTREHLGQTVSLMIDGEPVTIHKIRSVITGAQFRLSRCTDHACEYIRGRLVAEP